MSNKQSETTVQIVRNAKKCPPKIIHEYPGVQSVQSISSMNSVTEKSGHDLTEPKLYSSLKNAKDVKGSCSKNSIKTVKLSKQNVPQKGLKKINIPFDEQIYKGLVDLRVNDEDIGITNVPMKAKEFVKNKEDEPVLSDYYKPVFDKEYIIKPNPPVFEIQKQFHYTGSSVLNRVNYWENIDPKIII